jgi:hypothetical protein
MTSTTSQAEVPQFFNLETPAVRDTFGTLAAFTAPTWTVLRWKVDSSMPVFFHCHISYHLAAGMATLFLTEGIANSRRLQVEELWNLRLSVRDRGPSKSTLPFSDDKSFGVMLVERMSGITGRNPNNDILNLDGTPFLSWREQQTPAIINPQPFLDANVAVSLAVGEVVDVIIRVPPGNPTLPSRFKDQTRFTGLPTSQMRV